VWLPRGQALAISRLGDAVGTPLTQLNLVVAALWGVLLYREVRTLSDDGVKRQRHAPSHILNREARAMGRW